MSRGAKTEHQVKTSIILRAIVAIGLVLGAAGAAAAQTYPNRPIRLIVPVAAGGPLDTLARITADKMTAKLGQPVIVENRAGAGMTIGARTVALAEPDGYTLLWASSSALCVLPVLYTRLDFDPKAFVPVALVATLPHFLVVASQVPAKTPQELAAYARANPGKLNYGAPLGTSAHLMAAFFAKMANADITFIPYKGAAPTLTDLLGGQTHLTVETLMVFQSLIEEGKLRALGVSSQTRWPDLPAVPTMTEAGFPGFPGDSFNGIVAPPGTPAAIVDKLNAAVNEGMGTPEVKASMTKLIVHQRLGTPREFADLIAAQRPISAEMVKVAGARID
jgi:tripartite-type tricarboxylate transporter receptor subunit TctC